MKIWPNEVCDIIEMVPYKILLVRPFDAITESMIVNDREGNQTINITCPNTGTRAANQLISEDRYQES